MVSANCWSWFIKQLSNSHVTHGFLSSSSDASGNHLLSAELIEKAKVTLRSNRKKHSLHCSPSNLSLIRQCDSLWWSPYKGYLYHVYRMESASVYGDHGSKKQGQLSPAPSTRSQHRAGSADGKKEWEFRCVVCRQYCSSLDPVAKHAVGSMFECSVCKIWSHVDCLFLLDKIPPAERITEVDITELDVSPSVLCALWCTH